MVRTWYPDVGTDVGKYISHIQHPALQSESEKLLPIIEVCSDTGQIHYWSNKKFHSQMCLMSMFMSSFHVHGHAHVYVLFIFMFVFMFMFTLMSTAMVTDRTWTRILKWT